MNAYSLFELSIILNLWFNYCNCKNGSLWGFIGFVDISFFTTRIIIQEVFGYLQKQPFNINLHGRLMKKLSFFIVPLFISLLFTSCDWFTSPEDLAPGRRDYVWEEDTIKVPEGHYTDMVRIWGYSPIDVWICGQAYISDHTIWHYDGTEWTNIDMNRFIIPFAVYGFSSNDVWIGTLESNIWHWDGYELQIYGNYTLPDYNDINIQNIWGPNPSEVFSVGYAKNNATGTTVGIIMKYNGTSWTFDQVYNNELTFLKIREYNNSGSFFVSSYVYSGVEMPYMLFSLHNNDLSIIFESNLYIDINEIEGNIYFGQGNQILKYNGSSFEVWRDFSNTNFLGRIWGRNESDFFTVNRDGLGHYNGTELITIYETNYRIENIQFFESDIFVLCHNNDTNRDIIIHGELD